MVGKYPVNQVKIGWWWVKMGTLGVNLVGVSSMYGAGIK